MKELVFFSIRRRFLNKTMKMLMILLIILFMFGFFLDKVVELFSESTQTLSLEIENIDEERLLLSSPIEIVIEQNADISIVQENNSFKVSSQNQLNDLEMIEIESILYPYYFQSLDPSVQMTLEQYRHPMIEYKSINQENLQQKHDNLFMVITAIYFMMLGFAGMLASEVVAEKTSNILEMIGTSVSLKTHYYSKIIIGWLSILLQFTMIGSLFMIGLISRYLFDNGQGLITFLSKHGLISTEATTFGSVIKSFLSNTQSIVDLFLALIFLFIGILIVQLLLVVISTRVNTIEEAGALQNPFYMGLLFLYYGALILNNPVSMSEGWGYILSFVPIFSMIFMPCRLMLLNVPFLEILTALIINGSFLVLVILKGQDVYVRQVLNFSPKMKKNKKKLRQA